MKVLYSILLALGLPVFTAAQKVYFVYLQTDNNRPFYVKIDDRLISAASSGYLILSNLRDSTCNFSVGFPSLTGESRFSFPINGRDHGFLIREMDDRPGLYDLQTGAVIRAMKEYDPGGIAYTRRTDDFSILLAKAAGDSTLLWQAVAVSKDVALDKKVMDPVPPKDESRSPSLEVSPIQQGQQQAPSDPPLAEKGTDIKVTDTAAVVVKVENNKDTPAPANVEKDGPLGNETTYQRSVVKRHSESSTSDGFGLVFYDTHDDVTDTIRLLIPNPRYVFIQPEKKEEAVRADQVQERPASGEDTVAVQKCKAVASEQDFLVLRRDMAARMSDEEMTSEARKAFSGTCFTTEQVRNLGALFLTPAGKYLFFSSARGHLTDPEHFATLQTEIRDDYYLKRFKALAGE